MKVVASIVNYRTADLAADAARSILQEFSSDISGHVTLVDNSSGDGSLERLEDLLDAELAQGRVTLIAADQNGGYGYGNNLAIRDATKRPDPPEYILVINPDTRVLPGSLRRLLHFMDTHPDVGLAGNAMVDEAGDLQVAWFRFPSFVSEFLETAKLGAMDRLLPNHVVFGSDMEHEREVDWISGSAMLMRSQVLAEVGLFDEKYFLYFEEVDFCRRVRASGWKIQFVPEAPIVHIGSVSTGVDDTDRPMPSYWFMSRHRYFRKHHGAAYTALCDAAWILGTLTRRARILLGGNAGGDRPGMLRNFIAHVVSDRFAGIS